MEYLFRSSFEFSYHVIKREISISSCLFEDKIIKTPPFAESVSEGDVRWSKKPGDRVVVDDILGEIETDKTAIPIHSPFAGTIIKFLVADGDKVIANQDLVSITLGEGGAAKTETKKEEPVEAKQEKKPEIVEKKPTKPAEEPSKSLKSDKLIREVPPIAPSPPLPTDTKPAGPVGEITGSRGEQRVKMNRMRLRIAERLKSAQNTCAMLTTFNECDMSAIIALRTRHKDAFLKRHGVKLGFMSAFLKASALALLDQPIVNAVIDGNDIVYRDYVDISVAVATPRGLVVPVLRDVQRMDFGDIERGIHALGERARLGQLAIEDMDGGTFTVSNGGVFGSMLGTPIINPPQSAILGVHATLQRPVAIDGRVEVRPMMYLALTYDHRLVDGREAVLFLRKVKSFVEEPATVLLGL